MLQLETYKGTKSRHTCPACHSKGVFVRYRNESGEYIADDVGRCNRESKCGYHQTPKMFFEANPHFSKSADFKPKARTRKGYGFTAQTNAPQAQIKSVNSKPDYIEQSFLLRTLANYENNGFVRFLLDLFPADTDAVEQIVKDYLIGTTKDGKTIFWQIDRRRNVRTGKIIAYDVSSGKRRKDVTPNWIHAELKKSGHLKSDFNLRQCFFGEHLLTLVKDKPVAIVEAEKTAVIADFCFPEFVWLACGAKQNLNAGKLQRFAGRRIILYPDADGFALWTEKAQEARANGLTVNVSSLIEMHGTDAQKANGYDLADYLVAEQTTINQMNRFIDCWNAEISNDENSNRNFEAILDEQKAVMIVDGALSEDEAERICRLPENLLNVALTVHPELFDL